MPAVTHDFRIALEANSTVSVNGTVKGRLVLTVGREQLVDRVTLDSVRSRKSTAKRWADRYGLDEDEVCHRLEDICQKAVALAAQQRKDRAQRSETANRISELADQFISDLRPEWHRNGDRLYCAKVSREVRLTNLWTLAGDETVDAIGDTKEALEAGDLGYRGRLGLFRDALLMAAARAIRDLPEHADVEIDATVSRDELLAELVAWLLKERVFRQDSGNPVSTSYYEWASGCTNDGSWRQCFTAPVFARFHESHGLQVAVKGEVLKNDLRRESNRKLAADLRMCGLADTDCTLRVARNVWRVWILTPDTVNSVATKDSEETL